MTHRAIQGPQYVHVNRRGFTLAEILVALALIAVLTAVLLPAVAGQILKGDASRVASDLNAVRAGAEQFLADVHRYPGKYSDLSTAITTTTGSPKFNLDVLGNGYSAGLVSKWKGPYVTKDTTAGVVATGFGGSIRNVFDTVTHSNNVPYLTIVVLGISGPDFDKIDEQVDGVVGRTAGLLRWVTTGTIDSTLFLAIPVQ